jgi:hypothetical protein
MLLNLMESSEASRNWLDNTIWFYTGFIQIEFAVLFSLSPIHLPLLLPYFCCNGEMYLIVRLAFIHMNGDFHLPVCITISHVSLINTGTYFR